MELNILCFHRVIEDHDIAANWPWISRGSALTSSQFQRVLERWSHTHRWVDESDVLAALDDEEALDGPCCWVTFDDGYLDNLTVAAPILRRFGVRPTLFVTASITANGFRFPVDRWYDTLLAAPVQPRRVDLGHGAFLLNMASRDGRERLVSGPEKQEFVRASPARQRTMLSALKAALSAPSLDPGPAPCPGGPAGPASYLDCSGLRSLASLGWRIGRHGSNHQLLPGLAEASLTAELRAEVACPDLPSAARSRFLAWPDGAFDARCIAMAEQVLTALGVRGALTIAPELPFSAESRWALPRRLVTPADVV